MAVPLELRRARLMLAAVLLANVAVSAVAQSPAPALEGNDKMAAVNKVIELLEDLQTSVLEEGNREAKSYDQFACFCKDVSQAKTTAVQEGKDEKLKLTSQIESDTATRERMDVKIADELKKIQVAEQEMKVAKKANEKALELYAGNSADLNGALNALASAIAELEASKGPAFVQLPAALADTLQSAAVMADALGIGGQTAQRAMAALVQGGRSEPWQDYEFHSDDIITTLKKLEVDFKNEKDAVDQAEQTRLQNYKAYMKARTDIIKAANIEIDTAKTTKEQAVEAIQLASSDLSTISATILDDQEYLAELTASCSSKAKTWDQRTKVRADELSALTAAISIIKGAVSENTSEATIRFAQLGTSVRLADEIVGNPAAMNEIEAAAEAAEASASAPLAFLQKHRTKATNNRLAQTEKLIRPHGEADGRKAVVALLRERGEKLKSTMLTGLASQIAAASGEDPFAKVKILIQELIERLLTEAGRETNQKGWCDKSISDASQKRDYAAEKVEGLNSRLAALEARRDKLVEELDAATAEIGRLTASQAEADELRANETAENEATITEANQGLGAVQQAITILARFYKTAAKSEVPSLLQRQTPAQDMPDAGFESGEAYKGAQGKADGVLGMLEVIKSDFERTVSETKEAEAQAKQDHYDFTVETQKSISAKQQEELELTKRRDETVAKIGSDNEELTTQTDLIVTAVQELLALKPACIDTSMSYDDRVARREEEIAALKQALCILEHMQDYGPDGAGGSC